MHVPKSLDRQANVRDSRAAELAFLQTKVSAGEASKAQQARYHHLRDPSQAARTAAAKQTALARLSRSAEETCLDFSLRALDQVLARTTRNAWRDITGLELPDYRQERILAFGSWMEEMEAADKSALRDVLQTHAAVGGCYKSQLAGNTSWLKRARLAGVAVHNWLNAPPQQVAIAGRVLTIAVESDPSEVFRMGSYFSTCLSIGEFNQMAVLANAYDANKQVIYVRDEKQCVIARKLISISRKYGLLGFQCYVSLPPNSALDNQAVSDAISAYCGRLAADCGIPLSDEGEPHSPANLWWYNDGTLDWEQAAHDAWKDRNCQIHSEMSESATAAMPSLVCAV